MTKKTDQFREENKGDQRVLEEEEEEEKKDTGYLACLSYLATLIGYLVSCGGVKVI